MPTKAKVHTLNSGAYKVTQASRLLGSEAQAGRLCDFAPNTGRLCDLYTIPPRDIQFFNQSAAP